MSFIYRIKNIGNSKRAWQCLAVLGGIITFGYYSLLVSMMGVPHAPDGGLVFAGLATSFVLTVCCWNISEKLIFALKDDELDEVVNQLVEDFYEFLNPEEARGGWEPKSGWLDGQD